jgi:hypothetical protein
MSICSDVKSDCRVDLPRISTYDSKGQECAIVPGKIGDLGSKIYTTPYNVVYYRPGVTVREFNHAGLRLPQKREFLGPEFFNTGCATLFGNNRFNVGPNSADTDSIGTQAMYDYNFAPQPYFQGNDFDCYNAGVKCVSPNSALGWMLTKDDKLLWKSKNQEELTQDFCGTQTPLADRTHAMAVNGLY